MLPAMNRRERRAKAKTQKKAGGDKQAVAPLSPSDAPAVFKRAVVALNAGALRTAEEKCRALLARFPEHAETLDLLGVVRARQGDAAEAATLMARGIALAPTDARALNNFANVLTSLGRREEAVALYRRALAQRPDDAGIAMPAAPSSGGNARADDGSLTVMASGSEAAFAGCEEHLAAIAGKVYRLGAEPGQGSTVKMVHQLLAGVHIAAAGEAMALAARAGIDPAQFFEVATNGAADSWMLRNRGPRMLSGDPTPFSAVEIFVKDLGIVLQAGRDLRFPLPIAAAAHQQFLGAAAAGHGREDDSRVVSVYETLAGISVATAKGDGE